MLFCLYAEYLLPKYVYHFGLTRFFESASHTDVMLYFLLHVYVSIQGKLKFDMLNGGLLEKGKRYVI